jgi:Asp-tRNA(Asn)/Glu-tRNA(Gln) amidotransferase A subunit family amidase
MHEPVSRRTFIASASLAGAAAALGVPRGSARARSVAGAVAEVAGPSGPITVETIAAAEVVAGISFTPAQRELMLEDLQERLEMFDRIRAVPLPNAVTPSLVFDPRLGGATPAPPAEAGIPWEPSPGGRPTTAEDLAFATVAELSGLLRQRAVTSVELAELYLDRLERLDDRLHAVVTFTRERALDQARAADAQLDAGRWLGPLHGVPWGAKDLLAVRGHPTTWGAMPYRDQVIDADAAVVERLDAAGAVLVAKLTLGALAWGDVWFGGRTNNPWNPEQGSSGSSAGPGAAVSAGLVGFAIGSETLGSIVSPATRNGVTGFRPTFGRVSRHGAMTLSWSMDKLGPMARCAEDCALVFAALHGRDPRDPSTTDARFRWPFPLRPDRMRVGYVAEAFEGDYDGSAADAAVLGVLRDLGFEPEPVALPDLPADAVMMMLEAEAAAAFDELTRSGGVDSMVRQERNAWPNVFRHARLIPAVDYINASRVRTLLMREMGELFAAWDVVVCPSFRGGVLGITNLTGHPSVTVPNRFDPVEDDASGTLRAPGSITFLGGLYRDDQVLATAHAYQQTTDFHRRRPPVR